MDNTLQKNGKVGAALVVGGGIGGMQAALDLAESGIKVFLVESKPCIGGVMSQLDKTFPTNDCAMCTMAPRLVEIGRHKDIQIITLADIEKIEGEEGNFTVTIRKKSKYIDEEKCTGCGECQTVCPIEIVDEYNAGFVNTKAIYRLYPQAVPNTFTIMKLGQAPCRYTCPLGQRPEGYIALIREKRYNEAFKVILDDNPFPSVCGRVCVHICEDKCARGEFDSPVSIMRLKRFVTDWVYKNNPNLDGIKKQYPRVHSEKIAIVGAGPAGLTCGYDLVKKGYSVTVFEATDKIGGMMALSIPDFRLPKDVLERDIKLIKEAGVEIKTNSKITDLDELKKDYNAIFLATGCFKSQKMGIENEDMQGVVHGLNFLLDVNAGKKVQIGKKVAIIGGGNVAMDSARTAKRLGAEEVFILYRRSRAEMPASKEEIEEVEEEGIKIQFLTAPVKAIGKDGKLEKLECVKMELGAPDESGRRKPIKIEGSEFTIDVDNVIAAIGQTSDVKYLEKYVEFTKWGTIKVNPDTMQTNVPHIFAGGDIVSGPWTLVGAIADGHKAANMIDKYLRGEELKKDTKELSKVELTKEEIKQRVKSKAKRHIPSALPLNERMNFKEVFNVYTEEEAIAEAERCLECGICSECLMCVETCKANAINHDMPKEKLIQLNVGAIILSPGYDLFSAGKKSEYGYGHFQNVITGLEFERLLSASGPFSGHVFRPSDKKEPKRIAFIQCVGSRDADRDYCSSVCCMYATKQAIIAKEHIGEDLKCDIFFMDLRAFSKGFDEYYQRAKSIGVEYIRCRISSIDEVPETKDLKIWYLTEDDTKLSREYDMVILSTGLRPPKSAEDIAKKFGIKLTEEGFCETDVFKPVHTFRPGVFAAGPFTEPKDIPETVTQASASASQALEILSAPGVKGSMITPKEYPQEIDVSGQEPRIGIFVCHCGTNIAGVVDVLDVVEYAKTLPNVVYAENNLYTCSNDAQERIKQIIKEQNLNRVIVASCTPRTHEPLFRNTVSEAGLNPYLFEMANIRDQCSWVHMHLPEAATKKAKDLVRMAVAKSSLLEPLQKRKVPINKDVLVIGGGVSGMTAALSLGNQGFKVHLIEREKELGGNFKRIHYLLDKSDPQTYLKDLIASVKKHNNISVYTSAKIESIDGFIGNFKTKFTTTEPLHNSKIKPISEGENGKLYEFEHGAVIVATGAEEYKPTEYLYGKNDRVMVQIDLEEKLATKPNELKLNTVVMIQCVGSRDNERPYCSRICCSQAIKNALKIKEINPKANVFILYRDIRTYGFKEKYYTQARKKGVIFIRYEEDKKPIVEEKDGKVYVKVYDYILKKEITIPTDLVVLSAGIVAHPDNKDTAQMLKVSLNLNNFFLEAHMKLRPLDFATDGVFLCGLAHFPKTVDESIAQALGATSRVSTILSKDYLELEATISSVIDQNCDGCAYCVDPCPYKALTLIEYMKDGSIKKVVEVNEAICKGCGTCQATCPKQGIVVKGFKLEQIAAQIAAALETMT